LSKIEIKICAQTRIQFPFQMQSVKRKLGKYVLMS
jgi:hypothetical protein